MLTEVVTRESKAQRFTEIIDGAIEALTNQLAQGHTQDYLKLLLFWSRFHRYSHANVILIMAQRPDATQVAGYHTWKRMGRQVKKGSRSMSIWCPIIRQITDPDTGLLVDYCFGFSPCPVFAAEDLVDIDTIPLPSLWKPLPDDAEMLYRYLKSRIEQAGYPVNEQRMPTSRQGSVGPDGVILVAADLDSRNRIMVLLHELAHALEHFRAERQEASRDQKELEAESASAIVCTMLGIEHPTARDYILMYRGDVEGFKASLAAIRRIVKQIVTLLALTQPAEEHALAAD